jgi:dTDP-4-amino-4,6-dideoxygalactose transaminase
MNVPFVDLQAQYHSIKDEVTQAVIGVMERSDFVLGHSVKELEDNFALFCGAPYAVGVDSGYSALEMILRAYAIGPGDEVITAANTFIATALAIWSTGAKPVLVDALPDTYCIDPAKIEAAITPATKAIIPVHLYGQPAEMEPILVIAKKHGLKVIEDACQAHGARYNQQRTGSLGDSAAFSFYPAKNLGAYGDGGMVVTKDADVAEKIKIFRNVGQKVKNEHIVKGFNHRLDTLQAAVLNVKLPHLDAWNAGRRQAAASYDKKLAGLPVIAPKTCPEAEPVYHLYVVRAKDRNGLAAHLNKNGISTGIHYPIPIHLQPAFQDLGYKMGDFPVTERVVDEILSLPMYAELDEEKIQFVVEKIKDFH